VREAATRVKVGKTALYEALGNPKGRWNWFGLSGATIRALVPRAPNVDLCPGRLATTDAQ
jgi:hypothetical protein